MGNDRRERPVGGSLTLLTLAYYKATMKSLPTNTQKRNSTPANTHIGELSNRRVCVCVTLCTSVRGKTRASHCGKWKGVALSPLDLHNPPCPVENYWGGGRRGVDSENHFPFSSGKTRANATGKNVNDPGTKFCARTWKYDTFRCMHVCWYCFVIINIVLNNESLLVF